ncbi:hypothetical protein AWW66_03435 [Micromonospora rosaria]|uniref:Uncharacterized protein n=1 Tax=Micromonospora rosaria TaxID=47874 RepID=A0A136PY30_9ACTN|nr:hypothetical protein [Micromonospora rosaria]KXK63379.1 hypothetical protein AWW66_03435 [Micromonospora rosaria]
MNTPAYPIEKCRSCPTQIIWAVTERGRDMPVDAEPAANGNVALSTNDKGQVVARIVKPHLAFGRKDLRLPHFVRCPQADRWRQR